MVTWLLAMAAASSAVVASGLRLYRVRTALRVSPVALARSLGRAGGRDRLRRTALEKRAEGAIWEADLLDDVLSAPSEAAREAIANEHLGDLAARLEWGSHIPRTAARLSIAVPLCAVFVGLATQTIAWPSALPAVVCAGVGAVASMWAGREAERVSAGLREGVDMLVERSLRAAASDAPEASNLPADDSNTPDGSRSGDSE
jgi:hypothetical protein